MGFIEETGAAQYSRDVRVTAIYEGTNGIQAMDLVGRKMADGGEAAHRLLDEIEAGAEAARADCCPIWRRPVWDGGRGAARGHRVAGRAGRPERAQFAGAVAYLRAFARVLGGHVHLASALRRGRRRAPHPAGGVLHRPAAARACRAAGRGAGRGRRGLGGQRRGPGGMMDGAPGEIRYPFAEAPGEGAATEVAPGHPVDAAAAADGAGPRQRLRAGRRRPGLDDRRYRDA